MIFTSRAFARSYSWNSVGDVIPFSMLSIVDFDTPDNFSNCFRVYPFCVLIFQSNISIRYSPLIMDTYRMRYFRLNNEWSYFMKYGVRKPSVKKSISARTTGVSDILNDNEPEEPTVLGTIGAFF